ncbi:MAG: DUF725 domain-containing protein [Nitrospina sp.]|jgi:hypothetical protein|nr:DUF725 domain-containing protein [Nitrospina sp.]MBT7196974.1 DUF725 domain-containing protein [Nitrospina sp.]MBT7682063.1 DUF725 domain-containing protein [Nitrospina sp.]
MEGILKIYLLGFLVSATGVADQKGTQIAKAQLTPPAASMQTRYPNTYKGCLLSAKKRMDVCKTKLNQSIKSLTGSAHKIFRKQRKCEADKEQNFFLCKKLFLK